MSLVSMYFSKLIASLRVRLSSREHSICSLIQPLAVKDLKMRNQKSCINSLKHFLRKFFRLVSLIQTTKNSLPTRQILISNQSKWKMKISGTPKHLYGLTSGTQFWYRLRDLVSSFIDTLDKLSTQKNMKENELPSD